MVRMTRRTALGVALLTIATVLSHAVPAAAADELRWAVPKKPIVDKTRLKIVVEAPSSLPESQLRMRASGGTLGSPRVVDGGYLVDFTPPVVAETTDVIVKAWSKRRPGAVARRTLTIEPKPLTTEHYRTGGPLDLELPRRLVLGQSLPAPIRFRTSGATPRVIVTAGSMGALTRKKGGRFQATFVPPERGHPRYAMVAVIDDATQTVDWGAIQLDGRPRVKTRSVPGATVRVSVGGRSYGPLRADPQGGVPMRVTVPPDVHHVTVVATDHAGNTRSSRVQLDVSRYDKVLLSCPDTGRDVWIFALGRGGEGSKARAPSLSTSKGKISEAKRVSRGLYRARLNIAPESRGHGVVVKARFSGLARSRRGSQRQRAGQYTCTATLPSVLPSGLTVSTTPSSYTAGSGERVGVVVQLRYPAGRKRRAVALSLAPEIGEVDAPKPMHDGRYSASWKVPDHFGQRLHAAIDVSVSGAGQLGSRGRLELRGAEPRSLAVTADDDTLAADGESTTTVSVEALDRFGNVAFATVQAEAEGHIGPFSRQPDGRFVATYTAPNEPGGLDDEITVRAHGHTDAITIELYPPKKRIELSVRAGYLTNFAQVSAPMAALVGDFRLPVLSDNLIVGIDASFFYAELSGPDTTTGEMIDAHATAFPLLGRLVYELPIGAFALRGGAAAGALLVQTYAEGRLIGDVTRFSTRFGATPLLGGGVELGPGRALVELGYLYATIDDGAFSGQLGGFHATAGYGLGL